MCKKILCMVLSGVLCVSSLSMTGIAEKAGMTAITAYAAEEGTDPALIEENDGHVESGNAEVIADADVVPEAEPDQGTEALQGLEPEAEAEALQGPEPEAETEALPEQEAAQEIGQEEVVDTGLEVEMEEQDADVTPPYNLENPEYEFQLYRSNQEAAKTTAEGRPRILVFYNLKCYNAQQIFKGIAGSEERFANVDIYALQYYFHKGIDEYIDTYGCDSIHFAPYHQGEGYTYIDDIKDAYVKLFKTILSESDVAKLEAPFMVYIDADNKVQYASGGIQSASTILSNLEKYCGAENTQPGPEVPEDLPKVPITPTGDNVVIHARGSFYTDPADTILKKLNEIRLEACKEGVKHPSAGRALTEDDYVPVKWSSGLEAIARVRAAEASITHAHERPNGKGAMTLNTENRVSFLAENLAFNNQGILLGIDLFYTEKKAWVNETPGAVTGHYTSMIDPDLNAVGLGCFVNDSGPADMYTVAMDMGTISNPDETKNPSQSFAGQDIEISPDRITDIEIGISPTQYMEENKTYQASAKISFKYLWSGDREFKATEDYVAGGTWTSSDTSVVTVDETGKITAVSDGEAVITFKAGDASENLNVTVYKEGQIPFQITKLPRTTYRTGESLDLSAAEAKAFDGGTEKTITITEDMVSGFDSSKPGICKVTVTYNNRSTDFDVLVVQIPEYAFETDYGLKLSDVEFSDNKKDQYGALQWQEPDTILECIGENTFKANYVPKDTQRFSTLSDIAFKVTVFVSLGGSAKIAVGDENFVYNGTELKPEIVVSVGELKLTGEEDYTVEYQDNINAGEASVIATGKGFYKDSITGVFTIQPASLVIAASNMSIETGEPVPEKYLYEAKGLVEGDKLIKEPEFACNVTSTDEPGTYEVIPSGADAGTNYTISYENGVLEVVTAVKSFDTYRVKFNMKGHGDPIPDYVGVWRRSTIAEPAEPTEDGYIFGGWYKDYSCKTEWNFALDKVASNTTLYAKWTREEGHSDGRIYLSEVKAKIGAIKKTIYTGSAQTPVVKVTAKINGKAVTLSEGKDYTVYYDDNINVGKANVTVVGRGAYTGSVSKTFTIKPKPIKNLKVVTGNATVGSWYSLPVYVFDGDKLLENRWDYSISAKSSLTNSAGWKTLTIKKGSGGNYTGKLKVKINVTSASSTIEDKHVSFRDSQVNYNFTGSPVEPEMVVKVGETVLDRSCYSVQYINNVNSGNALAIVSGEGSYGGSVVKTFRIKPVEMSFTVSGSIGDIQFDGKKQQPNVTVTSGGKMLTEGVDYLLSYRNNVHVSTADKTAYVVVSGIGNYVNAPYVKVPFRITQQSIVGVTVKGKQNKLVVTYDAVPLVENVDYTIQYGSEAGNMVEVQITGMGDFTGTTVAYVKK